MLGLIIDSLSTMTGRLLVLVSFIAYFTIVVVMFALNTLLGLMSVLLGIVWFLAPAFLEWCAGDSHEPKWHGQGPMPQLHDKHHVGAHSGSSRNNRPLNNVYYADKKAE